MLTIVVLLVVLIVLLVLIYYGSGLMPRKQCKHGKRVRYPFTPTDKNTSGERKQLLPCGLKRLNAIIKIRHLTVAYCEFDVLSFYSEQNNSETR